MKSRFSTVDIVAIIHELQTFVGMRVNQVYDVDNKTYLIKLNRYEEKVTLLLESGIRFHTTEYEWPKNPTPSGFSMKLRKHIKNKRLEKLSQLGVDRVIDFQFGVNEAAYHIILELYDRGNIILTDCDYIILNIVRRRTAEDEDVKIMVREKYPIEKARQSDPEFTQLKQSLNTAKCGDNLRKIVLSNTIYGPALIDHIFLAHNISKNACIDKDFSVEEDTDKLLACMKSGDDILNQIANVDGTGYIIQENKFDKESNSGIVVFKEFHPYFFDQYKECCHVTCPTFDKAVDKFFSLMEAQKIDIKTHQKEKEAMKKLANVKKDHEQRLNKLLKSQSDDVIKAELIEMNLDLVDKALLILRSAVANQVSWKDIWDIIQEAQIEGDEVAKAIKSLKLQTNHFTILLSDPFNIDSRSKPQLVDIDLDLSAYANARKYYNLKRQHAKKEQKTIEATEKAFKNAEKKTKQTLKEVATISNIIKARKPLWFEKFIWFISSENYLVIAGRDIQQNEVIVKRYFKPGDIYVHADIHGASSIIIKNPSKNDVPPKTLNEAGTFAVCYSAAWDSKILTSAWWVYHHQVSKTAPTGEYLTAGSFMIRGKKNYLLPSHLILGFGFLFKLSEDSIERHSDERKVKHDEVVQDDAMTEENDENINIEGSDVSSDENEDAKSPKEDISKSEPVDNVEEKNISEAEQSENETENLSSFPDTKVRFDITPQESEVPKTSNDAKVPTVIIASSKKQNNQQKENKIDCSANTNKMQNSNCQKRGKKGKLKKIKEKYKDQDEEERALKMKILASAGESKNEKKKKGSESKTNQKRTEKPKINIAEGAIIISAEELVLDDVKVDGNEDDDDGDEEEDAQALNENDVLNSLTGCPVPEDTLLFAVPACAPYSAMQNYKHKVKMMPGTNRRGKAAKAALHIFIHDKSASSIEKDCLRSVKDQDISRNFPGKIKLSYAGLKKK